MAGRLQRFSNSNTEPCNICFAVDTTNSVKLPCSHLFCCSCVLQWRDTKLDNGQKPTCPLCRKEFYLVRIVKMMNIKNGFEQTREDFNCGVCRRVITYRDSFSTPSDCSHRTCFKCLLDTATINFEELTRLRCPVCAKIYISINLFVDFYAWTIKK